MIAPWLPVAQAAVYATGVSPYLPLNLEPEIESQIERVLMLSLGYHFRITSRREYAVRAP
jgi:hypothetical protein